MKHCPKCNRNYDDDTLAYCLDDGSVLGSAYDPQATLRIPMPRVTNMPPTLVAPPYRPSAPPPPQASSRWPIFVVVALLLFVLGGGAVVLMIVAYSRMQAPSSTKTETQSGETQSSPSPSPSPVITSQQLVGVWRTNVFENNQSSEITVTFLADGSTRYAFKDGKGRTGNDTGTWQYSDGILFERFSNGASGKGSIRWIDKDNLEITIIDNGVPAYSGRKRRYRRIG